VPVIVVAIVTVAPVPAASIVFELVTAPSITSPWEVVPSISPALLVMALSVSEPPLAASVPELVNVPPMSRVAPLCTVMVPRLAAASVSHNVATRHRDTRLAIADRLGFGGSQATQIFQDQRVT
jgi:hypothetical protein